MNCGSALCIVGWLICALFVGIAIGLRYAFYVEQQMQRQLDELKGMLWRAGAKLKDEAVNPEED